MTKKSLYEGLHAEDIADVPFQDIIYSPVPHLYILPYLPGIAEYAAIVRSEIIKRKGSDFIIAVDLPHGLENELIQAVKKLPRPSIIVDPLMRTIPILPSSAPVEAVRSFLEYGLDITFIDASLPITGDLSDYTNFVNLCQSFGIETVLNSPETFGIRIADIFLSSISQSSESDIQEPFVHIPETVLDNTNNKYSEAEGSVYLQTRLQYMTMQIKKLLKNGTDILLVCNSHYCAGVEYYLDKELKEIHSDYTAPTKTYSLYEEDIIRVTREVPYFAYLYELYRDHPIDRLQWIQKLFLTVDHQEMSPLKISDTISYSSRLALAKGEIYPDIQDLTRASHMIGGETYRDKVFQAASRYPPAKSLPDRLRDLIWFLLNRGEALPKEIDQDGMFFIFEKLDSGNVCQTYDFTSLIPAFILEIIFIEDKKRKVPDDCDFIFGRSISRWTRTPESRENETTFLRYILLNYPPDRNKSDSFESGKFLSGLKNGIDIRGTIRHWNSGDIYVKEFDGLESVAYIFDYRDRSVDKASENVTSSSLKINIFKRSFVNLGCDRIFFDRHYPWVGVVKTEGKHMESEVLVAFTDTDIVSSEIFHDLNNSDPLNSALKIAVEYAKKVIIFTDNAWDIRLDLSKRPNIKIYPFSKIPIPIAKKMKAIDIAFYRNDNRRDD